MYITKEKSNNKLKRIIICIFMIIFIMFGTISFAKEQKGNINIDKLVYTINIKENGDVDVIEDWTVTLEKTTTLSKKFVRDDTFGNIKNVSVTEYLTGGRELEFYELNEYTDELATDTFFSAINPEDSSSFEIKWGANQYDSSQRQYRIKYTIDKMLVKFNDCMELNWRFISDNFDIPITHLMGTIEIPNNDILEEEVKVWSHSGAYNKAMKVSNNNIYFEGNNINKTTYFQTRVIFPTRVISSVDNFRKVDADAFERIIIEEKEREEKEEIHKIKISDEVLIKSGILIIINILILFLIKDKMKIISQYPRMNPEIDYDYFKNIPDEKTSPAEVLKLVYRKNLKKDVFFSTLLSLCLKGWIDIEIKSCKKEDIIFKINKEGIEEKTIDEEALYIYLSNIHKIGFSLKKFEQHGIKKYRSLILLRNEISKDAEAANIRKKYIDLNKISRMKMANYYILLDILLVFIGLPIVIKLGCNEILMALYILLTLVDLFDACIIKSNMNDRTQLGTNVLDKWLAFKSYMENFNLIDKKKLPKLEEWERNFVYAAAFGIEDTVIDNLRHTFPELNGPLYNANNRKYRILDIMCDEKIGLHVKNNIKDSIDIVTQFAYKHNGEVMKSSVIFEFFKRYKKDDWN